MKHLECKRLLGGRWFAVMLEVCASVRNKVVVKKHCVLLYRSVCLMEVGDDLSALNAWYAKQGESASQVRQIRIGWNLFLL
jgi:hypothetical protein